ncbi:MAG: phosphatidate cytidylyltransferase, partial [Candidatus Kapabacteria bacterium]|nr:phosphatidate cytidylyltransferase [Candidatus Kapabacteria bacterium]
VGIPVAIGIMYLGGIAFAIAVVVVTALALREFYGLAGSKHASPNVAIGIAWSAALQLVVALYLGREFGEALALIAIALILLLGTLVTLTAELFRARENALLNTALTVFGVAYISASLSSLLFIRSISEPELVGTWGDTGTTVLLVLFVSVWLCDSAAYFVGMSIGKHKLFPRVSPKKSWEGAIGGLIAAVLAFYFMSSLMLPALDPIHGIVCGLIVGVFGPIGDLVESLLKRDAVVKDSGGILPGHGGVFDRFDSMLFAAPLVLLYLYLDNIIRLFSF